MISMFQQVAGLSKPKAITSLFLLTTIWLSIFYFWGFIYYFVWKSKQIVNGYTIRHDNYLNASVSDSNGALLAKQASAESFNRGVLVCDNRRFLYHGEPVSEWKMLRNFKKVANISWGDNGVVDQIIQDCHLYRDGSLILEEKDLDAMSKEYVTGFIKKIRSE